MAAQQPNIKPRTLQSIDKELEALLVVHDDIERNIFEVLNERERVLALTRVDQA